MEKIHDNSDKGQEIEINEGELPNASERGVDKNLADQESEDK